MSAGSSSSPAAAGSSSSSSASGTPKPQQQLQQEFGTLWIQDKNGVSQMLRVLHATPTKLSAAAGGEGGSGTAASAGGSGPVSVVRAVMKPTPPSQRVALQQQAQVLRRTVHLQASPRRLLVANQALGATCRPLTPKRRVLPTRLQAVAQQPSPRLNSAPSATSSASPGSHINAVRSRNSYISPILDHSGSRKRQNLDDLWSDTKRRRTDKSSKGLRHFSMKVCQKVRAKGTTTYNEVADELVAEYSDPRTCEASVDQPYDQKNIRRRVYDALNVLMAMHIISKEKKEIRWLGLPTNALQDCKQLEREKAERMHRINVKTQQLKDLLLQQIAFKRLVERNREAEQVHGPPLASSTVQLPFIVVNTDKKTVIDCSISNDKMEYLFNFDDTFEIHDDIEVLKRMGMALGLERGDCSAQDVQLARSLVAPALAPYIDQLGREGALTLQSVELEAVGDDEQRPSSITPSIDVDSDDDAELEEDEEDPVPETEPSDD